MKAGLKNKNEYQKRISIYKQRREALKAPYKSRKYWPAKVTASLKTIRIKILIWNRAIKRIEETERKMDRIDAFIQDYFNLSVKNSNASQSRDIVTARSVFYKIGIEGGIKSRNLARYCGMKYLRGPTRDRLKFTRSFKTKPANREIWHRFKRYVDMAA